MRVAPRPPSAESAEASRPARRPEARGFRRALEQAAAGRVSRRGLRSSEEADRPEPRLPAGWAPLGRPAGQAPPLGVEKAPPGPGPAAPEVQAAIAWMARAATQAAAGPGHLALVLRDPRLGTLDLRVTVRGRRVRLALRCDRPSTRAALAAERPALQADLRGRGLVLDAA